MNIYSVLDSDDDEPKVTKQNKAVEKAAPKKPAFEAPIERDPKAGKKEHHSRHGEKGHHKDGTEATGNPRKRQFDRKSGTGRGKEVAKGGAGGANWGNDKLEALNAEKHLAGDAVDLLLEEPAVDAAVEEPVEPIIPEPTVFTFDEYNRRKAEKGQPKGEAFEAVKLREVTADFSGMKTKEVDTQSDFIALGTAKATKAKKDQRSTSKTVVLDTAFTAAPSEQPERERRSDRGGDRDSRGGRGGARGGDRPARSSGGRGENRGDRPGRGGRGGAPRGEGRGGASRGPRGPRVDLNDAGAFPSL